VQESKPKRKTEMTLLFGRNQKTENQDGTLLGVLRIQIVKYALCRSVLTIFAIDQAREDLVGT